MKMLKGPRVGMKTRLSIELTNKVCKKCGRVHLYMPSGAVLTELGFWFHCSCNSTLIVRTMKEII